MNLLDRAFVILFARYRRRFGDSKIDVAFRSARYSITMYMGWALTAIVVVLLITIYCQLKIGTTIDREKTIVLGGAIIVFAVSRLIDLRFRKYLASPPLLSKVESPADAWYLFWFRILSASVFILTFLVGYLLRG